MKSKIAFVASLVLAAAFPVIVSAASFGTQNFFYAPSNVITPLPGFTTSWSGGGIASIASGGTATSSQITNGVNYFDGTHITSNTAFTWNGLILQLGNGSGAVYESASSTLSNSFVFGFNSLSTPGVTITSANNVGVASSSPEDNFSVSGTSYFDSGNVGISTSTPWGQLSISGTTISSTTPLLVAQIGASSTPAFIVKGANANGVVGIATTSPIAPFTVVSSHPNGIGGLDDFFGDSSAPYPVLFSHKEATGGGALEYLGFNVYNNPSGSTVIYNSAIGGWAFDSDARSTAAPTLNLVSLNTSNTVVNVMTFLQAGNIGAGTTTPTANFQVTTPSSNATTSVEFGKASQTRGTCLTLFDQAGNPVYIQVAPNAATLTIQNAGTTPTGCTD